MAISTFDRVLASAEALSTDDQAMLGELLYRRRIETWRAETAAEAATAAKKIRSGKLRSASVDTVIARLRTAK